MNNFLPSKVWQYCPYCGAKSFHAGHENYMQCDTCGKKIYINASGSVACIIENPQGEILLTRRAFDPAKGMLDLPGGFVSPDETAEDAVRREIKEELNLEIASMQYIGSSHNRYLYGDMVYFILDLGFKCLVADFTGIRVADDVDGYEFLQHNRINLQEISFPSIRNILQQYLQH
ncbi:MAG: NUDIX domain-containing protein, partial [Bacteroidales bacterium]|jgi:mutator protein MutT|nr:NUDIX domain-containing protein [Bacteroidales bacterium]